MTAIWHVDLEAGWFQQLDAFYKPVSRIEKPDQEPHFVFFPDAFHLRKSSGIKIQIGRGVQGLPFRENPTALNPLPFS